jgi:2-polyprenyl-6-methoxyphenol hydroxylase-like FAD-dependent oxidoreductase
MLREYLAERSCTVELGCELRGFEQFPDHVVAHLITTDSDGQQQEEHATFDWLVGADGAHSVVRKQLGLSFLGETRTEQNMALGDIVIEGLDNRVSCTSYFQHASHLSSNQHWHMWNVPPKL